MFSSNLVPMERTQSTSLINSCPKLRALLLETFGSGLGFQDEVKDKKTEGELQFDIKVGNGGAIAALGLVLGDKQLGGCAIRFAEGKLSNGKPLDPDELEKVRKFCGQGAASGVVTAASVPSLDAACIGSTP